MQTPVHLAGYDFISALQEWVGGGPEVERRSWQLGSRKLSGPSRGFCCTINWNMDGQCAGFDRCATTPEEAVWLCLEEVRKVPP